MEVFSVIADRSMTEAELDLCLDFSNTVDWRNGPDKKDNLRSYRDFVDWSRSKGLLTETQASSLDKNDPREAESALKKAILLRETAYRIFSSVARGERPAEAELLTLNSFLSSGMQKSGIEMHENSFGWSWRGDGSSPEMILWLIAKSAADLLTSDKLGIVRECSNARDGCAWLFLDTTKSHTKKWCSMESCGNRSKFRTYYQKHRQDQSATA